MIEVRNLTKRFGPAVAVDNLSFDVHPGSVTGFLGPNGAGKTTTMRVIIGLDHASSGAAVVNGRSYVDLPAPLREVGALLDPQAFHGGRRAYFHLLCLAQSNGIPAQRVDEVLDMVGLLDVARKRAGTFSLGMCQRLGIAAAMLGDPEVLMFDEPVNGLDPEGIRWIRTVMRALAAQGRTVLVSSHLMSEMALTADHLIVIGRGRLIADASVDDFIKHSSGRSVLVRTPDAGLLAPRLENAGASVQTNPDGAIVVAGLEAPVIGEMARQAGAALHELTPQEPSLEEAFMELTQDSVEFHANAPGHPTTPGEPTTPGADSLVVAASGR
jgi:ABC-2 type transport system ATP-binding protein